MKRAEYCKESISQKCVLFCKMLSLLMLPCKFYHILYIFSSLEMRIFNDLSDDLSIKCVYRKVHILVAGGEGETCFVHIAALK